MTSDEWIEFLSDAMAEKLQKKMTLEAIGGVTNLLAIMMGFYKEQTGIDISVSVIYALTGTIMNLESDDK